MKGKFQELNLHSEFVEIFERIRVKEMEVSQELCSGRSNGVSRPQDRGSSGNSCFQDYSNRSTRRLPHFSLLFEKEAKVSGPRTLTFETANGRNPFGRLMQIQW